MEIATSPTREKYPLSTKKVFKKTVGHSLVWIIFLSFGLVPLSLFIANFFKSPVVAILIYLSALFVVVLLVYIYEVWYFKVYYYDLTGDYVVIKKGPITPKEITIPYERIQDVYVDQDILDRIFGIYDVHLSSATISSGMQAHIDGVEKPAADGLRAELLNMVSTKISRNKAVPIPDNPISNENANQPTTN